ncbi:hypothetical protein [Flexithrix dorotheae]|uniref:hypothetical protein n=1 Tax=Flexithrix dorotheae TaxID=70993 RepID=UPI00036D20D0|nr:hypothetical protein [Flexithrix dorotheae]
MTAWILVVTRAEAYFEKKPFEFNGKLKTTHIKYDGKLNRFRLQLGLEFKITKGINYKTFWNHQFANDPSIQRVNAFGMSLKFYFQRF